MRSGQVEATAFAIRIDVAEELGRLAAHLDEIEAVLQKGGETQGSHEEEPVARRS